MTGVGKVKEKLLFAVLVSAPGDRRCPGVHKALVPGIARPRGTELGHVDGAVKGPVDQIVGRKHHQRLDLTITIFASLAVCNEFLTVVGTVDIQATVVFEGCGIGAEYAATDRIGITRCLEVGSNSGLGTYLEAHGH